MTTIATTSSATASSPTAVSAAPGAVAHRRLVRAACVVGAGLLNGAVFTVAHAAGVDFVITDPVEGAHPMAFTLPVIVVASMVFALLGWVSLALFERFTRRAARNWTALAVTVAALSMIPIGIELATPATRVMLGVIHALVLVALLPALRTTRR